MKPGTIITLLAALALTSTNIFGSGVAITPSQFGSQAVVVSSNSEPVTLAGSFNGGEFAGTIGTGLNLLSVELWCVDSQLPIAPPKSFNGFVEDLNGQPKSPFENSDTVRYGGVSTLGGTGGWVTDISGLVSNPNDSLTRYELTAILVSNLDARIDGGFNSPTDPTNQAIQDAIWRILDNNTAPAPGFSLTSVSDSTGVPAGSADWIAYAATILKANTFDFGQWAVVSGGFGDFTAGKLDDPQGVGAVQTFLVEVTPEPRYYAVLLVGILLLLGMARRQRRV